MIYLRDRSPGWPHTKYKTAHEERLCVEFSRFTTTRFNVSGAERPGGNHKLDEQYWKWDGEPRACGGPVMKELLGEWTSSGQGEVKIDRRQSPSSLYGMHLKVRIFTSPGIAEIDYGILLLGIWRMDFATGFPQGHTPKTSHVFPLTMTSIYLSDRTCVTHLAMTNAFV